MGGGSTFCHFAAKLASEVCQYFPCFINVLCVFNDVERCIFQCTCALYMLFQECFSNGRYTGLMVLIVIHVSS